MIDRNLQNLSDLEAQAFRKNRPKHAAIGKRVLKVTQILADEPHIDFKELEVTAGRMPNSAYDHAGENADNFLFVELGEGGHEVTAKIGPCISVLRV